MKVLVSPGYGAGWSSWTGGSAGKFMLTYQPIIDFIENGGDVRELEQGEWIWTKDENGEEVGTFKGHPLLEQLAAEPEMQGSYAYFGGADQLVVVETSGSFRIHEYDGYESVEYRDDVDWYDD